MLPISEVVHVNIFVEAAQVARASFGVPLIAAYHTNWPDRVRTYSSSTALESLVAEGFSTNGTTYRNAAAILAQSPKVRELRVGRLDEYNEQVITLAPNSAGEDGALYAGFLQLNTPTGGSSGWGWQFAAPPDATQAAVATGIAAAITAAIQPPGSFTVTATGPLVTIEPTATDPDELIPFEHSRPTGDGEYTIADTGSADGLAAGLSAIRAADPSFYGLVIDATSQAALKSAADWAETQRVIFVSSTANTAHNPEFAGATNKRTVLAYTKDYMDKLGAGWLGLMLPYDPGVATWAHKTVAGIPTSDELSATDIADLTSHNINHYTNVGGVPVMRWGKALGGTYVDNTICVDWATARIEEEVWTLLASVPKLPFTDMSGDRIGAAVMGVLLRGVNQGVFADNPAPTVTVPLVADIPMSERANRIFGTVEFTARLAGAIHEINIVGRVTV